jgi:hypothetical protein
LGCAASYYFSTHGCSLFFSGWAGDFDELALATASFWRALMSKKLAIVVVIVLVDVTFLDCSLVGICGRLPSRRELREARVEHFRPLRPSKPKLTRPTQAPKPSRSIKPSGSCASIVHERPVSTATTLTRSSLYTQPTCSSTKHADCSSQHQLILVIELPCEPRPPPATTLRHE